MARFLKWTGLILFAGSVGLALAVVFVAGARTQTPIAVLQSAATQTASVAPDSYPWGYGPGMMREGWTAYENGVWGMGPGMTLAPARSTGVGGYSHMGGMMGGYGGWGDADGVAPPVTPLPADVEIELDAVSFRFDPATITVNAGETVRLIIANQDGVPHNLYSPDVALAYAVLPPGVVQSVTFTAPATPGAYLAVCTFHAGMSLEIVVQ